MVSNSFTSYLHLTLLVSTGVLDLARVLDSWEQ